MNPYQSPTARMATNNKPSGSFKLVVRAIGVLLLLILAIVALVLYFWVSRLVR